jgi:hypothetical protein
VYYLLLKKYISNGNISNADISSICFRTRLKGSNKQKKKQEKQKKSLENSNKNIRDSSTSRRKVRMKTVDKSPPPEVNTVLERHHARIKNKTQKPDLNKLNNTTLLSFDEKIRGDSVLKSPGKRPRKDKLAYIYKTNDNGDPRLAMRNFNPRTTQNVGKYTASVRKVKNPSLSVTKKVGGDRNRYHSIVNTTQGGSRRIGGAFKGFDDKLVSSTIVKGRDKGNDRRIPLKNKASKISGRVRVRQLFWKIIKREIKERIIQNRN